jgi:hypothetical protein
MKKILKGMLDSLHQDPQRSEEDIYTIENKENQDYWLQITLHKINAYYPFADNPDKKLKELGVKLSSAIKIAEWQAESFITLDYKSNDIDGVIKFLISYMEKALNFSGEVDNWDIQVEKGDSNFEDEIDVEPIEESDIPYEWYLSGWEWSQSENKWITQPVLTVNGEDFTFGTRQEYIDKMKSTGINDENFLTSIDIFQNSVNNYPEVIKRTIFSKISFIAIITFLAASTTLLIINIFWMDMDEFRSMLPANCFESDFFILLVIIGTIYVIYKVGFKDYTPVFKSEGKTYVSYDMTDQIGAGCMTLLSPVLEGGLIALIPYYILYLILVLISNVYVLTVLALGIFLLIIWVLFRTRPKYSRKKETIWLILWLLGSYVILNLSYNFLI